MTLDIWYTTPAGNSKGDISVTVTAAFIKNKRAGIIE